MRARYVRLPVRNNAEKRAVLAAWEDPPTRALIVIMGTLLPLGRAKSKRILDFVGSLDADDFRAELEGA